LSQCWLWTIGYGLIIVLVVRCVWVVGKLLDRDAKPDAPQERSAVADEERLPGPGILTRLRWVALAFVPSSLMLGVTTYITLDIAAIPLLWVLPLALYLLSFILVFARWPVGIHRVMVLIMPLAVLLLVFVYASNIKLNPLVWITQLLLTLFVVALVCHGELAHT